METEDILNRMRKYCSKKECCKVDVYKKIMDIALKENIDIDPDEIIEKLCRERYIDEMRYAKAFAHDKSVLQGWGDMKIKYQLRQKGIDPDIIMSAVEVIDHDASKAKMKSLLEAYYNRLSGEEDEKFMKLLRFGIRRGFIFGQIKSVYDSIRSNKRD
ncbi:MAG: RecX family transcriptional regulator [Bacteroidales bacterium]|nr:RecX family transcriptional regulator [Bacteroidales bacterium]